MKGNLILAVALVAASLLPTNARADDLEPHWTGAVAFGTELPMSIGVRGQVEAPFRLRLSTTLGVMPGPYVGAINGFLVGVGAYNQATADLIREALATSLMWRTHLGYRPFRAHGLTVEAGYGLVALGGGASAAELITAMTGQAVPDQADAKNFKIGSALHMLDVELGWEWVLFRHLFVRAAVGGAFTLGSSTTITPDFQPRAPRAIAIFTRAGESYLDDTYRSYVFTPVVSMWAGWAF